MWDTDSNQTQTPLAAAFAAAQAPGHLAQAFVAGLVPVVVVVRLEVVDIDQQQAERCVVACGLRPDAVDVLVEHPAVVNPRQAVAAITLVKTSTPPSITCTEAGNPTVAALMKYEANTSSEEPSAA